MRILVADDHGIVRQGLIHLIENQDDMEVIGEAEDGLIVAQLAEQLLPDVILMDISMPNLNGVEATHLILKENPDIRIIALSVHFDKHFVTEMLKAGASGYVLKSCLFEEVLKALRTVDTGEYYISPKITEIMPDYYIPYVVDTDKSAGDHLTERERQIVRMVSEGHSIKQIALRLHISPKTADANRRQIMNKLGIFSIAELTKYAIREGITST